MNASQAESASANLLSADETRDLTFGIYDTLTDHQHCSADVVLAPVGEDGEPDWENASPTNVRKLPADEWPEDEPSARAACVIVSSVDGCDPDAAFLIRLNDGKPELIQIQGPESDRAVVESIIARDIGAAPPEHGSPTLERATGLLRARLLSKPAAANDNRQSAFIDAQTLLGLEFEPIKYVIPGYVAEGLTILGGRPKLGKSWLALDWVVAVASGGLSLGVRCEPGDAFYLALEDNQRRLQDRLRVVLPRLKSQRPDLSRLSLLTEAPKIGEGLIEALDAWRTRADDPRLIVVDTLAMVRPPKGRNQDSYAADYAALSPLQQYASAHRLAVVVVTHVRKMEASDPLEMISGTNGLTGAADSIMVLDRTTDGPKLYGRGRDVEEIEKALRFDGGKWSVLGNADDVKRSDERRKIIEALGNYGSRQSPKEIAEVTGMRVNNVSSLLPKMVKAGEVTKDGYGTYSVSPGQSDQTDQSPSTQYLDKGDQNEEQIVRL
ncbi:AAA family ATPase [Bradyrhizobium sp.]|uniref:AAA family ATPase n=1 Tax=Bradyrhizobium sp. TaxID=376 RepID=UPI0039E2CB2D